jgi:16S rRNA C1402 (ribose-2'-O) methylase RsmI
LTELIADLEREETVRGECTVVIHGADAHRAKDDELPARLAEALLQRRVPPRAITSALTDILDIPRRRAYQLAHPQSAGASDPNENR